MFIPDSVYILSLDYARCSLSVLCVVYVDCWGSDKRTGQGTAI
jgi:hypothetical protein